MVLQVELHTDTFGIRRRREIAVFESGIGKSIAEGIGHGQLLGRKPAVTNQKFFGIGRDEFLIAVDFLAVHQTYEDITLLIAFFQLLRIGPRGISR